MLVSYYINLFFKGSMELHVDEIIIIPLGVGNNMFVSYYQSFNAIFQDSIQKGDHVINRRLKPRIKQPERMRCVGNGMNLCVNFKLVQDVNYAVATGMKPGQRAVDEQNGRTIFASVVDWRSFEPFFRILFDVATEPHRTGRGS